jgi:hypothetical protein
MTIQDLGGGFSDGNPLGSLANIKMQKTGANSAVYSRVITRF